MKAMTYEETQQPDGTGLRFWTGIGSLFRQDPARKTLRYSIPIAVAVGSIIRLMAGHIAEDEMSLPLSGHARHVVPLLVQLWIFNLLGVIIAHFNSRCSRLSLGLPVAPRKLWLVRIVSVIGAGVIPAMIVFLIIGQGQQMFTSALNGEVLQTGTRVIAGLVLLAVLYQIPSPGVYRISGNRRYILYVVVTSAAVLLYTIFTPQSWMYTLAPVVAALFIGALVYAALPPGFTVIGSKPGAAPQYRDIDATCAHEALGRRGKPGLRLNTTVWRTLLNTWVARTMFVILAFYGVIFTYYYYNGHLEPAEYFMALLWFWILLCHSIKRLHNIDPLPVPRRLPFAHVMVTGILVMMVGSSVVTLAYKLGNGTPATAFVCESEICVPREFWEVTSDEKPPTVTTPWGESHTPGIRPFIRGGKLALYNPYEFHEDASVEFVRYQIDRALARIYGPDTVTDETVDGGTPLSENFAESLGEDRIKVPASVGRFSSTRSASLAVSVAIMSLLFALLNTVWFRRYRAPAQVRGTRWFAILFFSLPQVFVMLVVILEVRLKVDAQSVFRLPAIMIRKFVEVFPVGAAGFWTVAAAVVIFSFATILRQYEKVEAPPKKTGKHLLSEY